jgi:diphosphomevalonate decarboxylase
MSRKMIVARAPSNIALVKYMGKTNAQENLPANASLSMTLGRLSTWVELETASGTDGIRWDSSLPTQLPRGVSEGELKPQAPMLSEDGIARVMRHFERVRKAAPEILQRFGLETRNDSIEWKVRSCNTFPPASGIASSASSFAALTLASMTALASKPEQFAEAYAGSTELKRALAALSRRGSGSSCRSFEGPWVLWEGADAASVITRMPKMAHFVILISSEAKSVSSSEAHLRVAASPLWEGRTERVGERIRNLLSALGEGDVATVSRIAWTEAWEMHSLFHTSADPFTYWMPGTVEALRMLAPHVASSKPPIVTMDAGPNVHVSVPAESRAHWHTLLESAFGANRVLMDEEGKGAELIRVH